jgi:hypothetical protein
MTRRLSETGSGSAVMQSHADVQLGTKLVRRQSRDLSVTNTLGRVHRARSGRAGASGGQGAGTEAWQVDREHATPPGTDRA